MQIAPRQWLLQHSAFDVQRMSGLGTGGAPTKGNETAFWQPQIPPEQFVLQHCPSFAHVAPLPRQPPAGWQLAPTQTCPIGQIRPQPPQLASLVAGSMQPPPQQRPPGHAAPFGPATQPPVAPSQRWQAGQTTAAPETQTPFWQVSPVVQAVPSVQALPFVLAGLEQTPVAGSHVPASWH